MIPVEKPGSPEEVLAHVGVKGMRWGVRRSADSTSSGSGKAARVGQRVKSAGRRAGHAIDTAMFEVKAQDSATHQKIVQEASTRLVKSLPHFKAKHGEYGKLRNRVKHPFSPEAKAYRADVKKSYLKHLEKSANSMTNRAGTVRYTLKENGKPNTSQYFWKLSTEPVKHAADGTFTVRPIFDDEGWIIDLEIINDEMAQTMDLGRNFMFHMGIEV
jgi:hypothetical protein